MSAVGGLAVGVGNTNTEVPDCQRGADDIEVGCRLPPTRRRLTVARLGTNTARGVQPTATTLLAGKLRGTWTATTPATPSPYNTMTVGITATQTVTQGQGQGTEQSPEDNLAPNLPLSSKRRRWGLSFALVALIGLGCLLWVYRHSLPNPMDYLPISFSLPHLSLPSGLRGHLPHLSLSLPTISSASFTLPGKSTSRYNARRSRQARSSFRPEASSLLRWTEEEDPSLPNPTSSRAASSWRSKFPSLSTSKSGRSSRRPSGGNILWDFEDEGSDYEEVGLLPSPNSSKVVGSSRSYGTV